MVKVNVTINTSSEPDVIGSTLPYQGSIYNTLRNGFNSMPRMHSIQFHLTSTCTSWDLPVVNDMDRKASTEYCVNSNHNFYIHCPLQLNLARNDSTGRRMFDMVQEHCNQLRSMPASSVLHIGNGARGGTIYDVANNINDLNITTSNYNCNKYPLLLENCAGQGNDLGCSWDEFRHLYEAVDRTVIGLCVDTQHLFASGLCEFNDYWQVDKMWEDFESIVGKISLIHLNDSTVGFKGRVDRHENIGHGYIWGNNNLESLNRLYTICKQNNVDMILETPTSNQGRMRDQQTLLRSKRFKD